MKEKQKERIRSDINRSKRKEANLRKNKNTKIKQEYKVKSNG